MKLLNKLSKITSATACAISLLLLSGVSSWSDSLVNDSETAASHKSITEFKTTENRKMNWTVVDDGVMGGLSKGNLAYGENGILKFSGTLSLENNGGFSSVRSTRTDLDLSDADGIVMRVKGDGRTYQLRLATNARYRGREMSFKSEFATKEGQWMEVRVPFSSFEGTWRGLELPDKSFDPSEVQRVWLLLADKKEGAFRLEVDWIRTYSKS